MLWAVNEKYLLKRKKCVDEAKGSGLGGSVLFVTFGETWDIVGFS